GGSTGSETDGQPQNFTWNISDTGSGLASISVIIRQDGNVIYQTTDLANAVGSFDFNTYGLGTFMLDVTAIDADADRADDALTSSATRSVNVTDDDIQAPNIVLGGSEGVESDGDTNYFTWDVSDGGSGIGELSVIVRRNGAIIYETHDLGNCIDSFNFDSYGL